MTDNTVYTVVSDNDRPGTANSNGFFEKNAVLPNTPGASIDNTTYAVDDIVNGSGSGNGTGSFYEKNTIYESLLLDSQGNAGTALPLMDATLASAGIATKWSREDHVHPTETNPVFLGKVVIGANPSGYDPSSDRLIISDPTSGTSTFSVGFYDSFSGFPNNNGYAQLTSHNNDGYNDGFVLAYGRGTMGAKLDAQDGDATGAVNFRSWVNALGYYSDNAVIQGIADGPQTATSTPGAFQIYTTPSGAIQAVERVRVHENGRVEVQPNIASTSSTTGALTVSGGVGIAGALNVGGPVVVGGGAQYLTAFEALPAVLLNQEGAAAGPISAHLYSSTFGNASWMTFATSRSDTLGAQVAVTPDDTIMYIAAAGSDGSRFSSVSADMYVMVDGPVADFSVPGRWVFGANAPGDYNPPPRFVIRHDRTEVLQTTASSSTTTGALTVAGGLGVAGDIHANGLTATAGITADNLTLTNLLAGIELGSTTVTGGTPFLDFHSGNPLNDFDVRLISSGGTNGQQGTGRFEIWADTVQVGSGSAHPTTLSVINGAASTSTTTGAIVTDGGVGIAGALHVGATDTGLTNQVSFGRPLSYLGADDQDYFVVTPSYLQCANTTGSNVGIGSYDSGAPGGSNVYLTVNSYNEDGYGDGLYLSYSRGTSAAPLAAGTGDCTGIVSFQLHNGTHKRSIAAVYALGDGPQTLTSAPGAFHFDTVPSGSTVGLNRLRIDSKGNIVGGGFAYVTPDDGGTGTGTSIFQAVATNVPWHRSSVVYGNHTGGVGEAHFKTRGATPTTRGAVQGGDNLWSLYEYADDGTNTICSGSFGFYVDGAVSTNNIPAGFWINTGVNGYGVTRFEIGSDGKTSVLTNIASTSTTTGSLVVAGGVGIAGALNLAGVFNQGYAASALGYSQELHTDDTNTLGQQFHAVHVNWGTTTEYPAHRFFKSKSGTKGVHTAVSNNVGLGAIDWGGSDGTQFVIGAGIDGFCDGAVTAGHVPARISFFTASPTVSVRETMRLDGSGNLGIGGTANASTRLHIKDSATTALAFLEQTGVGTAYAEYVVGADAGQVKLGVQTIAAGGLAYVGPVASNIPLTFWTNSAERMRIAASGGVVNFANGFGYGFYTGVGGTVTQATSKSTGVTLSKVTGTITMNAAALAAGTIVSFALTNTTIAVGDVLVLNHVSGGTVGAYSLNAQCGAGTATINVRNNSASSLSEAVVIKYVLIKGANA